MPDGSQKVGLVEPFVKDEVGKVVQFERFGFVRIGESNDEVAAYFAHQ
jgi:glutamyl-tRNA synthetase